MVLVCEDTRADRGVVMQYYVIQSSTLAVAMVQSLLIWLIYIESTPPS